VEKSEVEILNYEFSFCLFFFAGVDIRLFNCSSSAFQAAYVCCIFVRRSATCGYEGYCLSGKGSLIVEGRRPIVFQNVFWLEKPNFHNRRIYSAARIAVRNLPERQYFSIADVDIRLWTCWRNLTGLRDLLGLTEMHLQIGKSSIR
jgi:hypothetical protein